MRFFVWKNIDFSLILSPLNIKNSQYQGILLKDFTKGKLGDFDIDGYLDIASGTKAGEDYEMIVWRNDGTPFSGTWTGTDIGTVDGDANQVKRMLKRQKIPFVEKAGKVHIVGQHAFNYAQIFSTTELKRPMSSGLLNPKEKDALPVLNAIVGELLGKGRKKKGKDEVCVYCIPAKPIDQTREVSYHEDVLKQIIKVYIEQ